MPFKAPTNWTAILITGMVTSLSAMFIFACQEKKDDTPVPVEEKPLAKAVSITGTDSVFKLTDLADTVKARALRGDTLGLLRLMINDSTYRRHIWPTSPAFDSSHEDAYRFVLGMHKANSTKGLRRMIFDVQTAEEPQLQFGLDFDSATVPGGMVYSLKRTGGFRIFGSALKVGESFQILSYSNAGAKGKTSEE